jgi:hypothetical protein
MEAGLNYAGLPWFAAGDLAMMMGCFKNRSKTIALGAEL